MLCTFTCISRQEGESCRWLEKGGIALLDPLRSSDCAHKASRKLGEVNTGQAVLQAVKQLCV